MALLLRAESSSTGTSGLNETYGDAGCSGGRRSDAEMRGARRRRRRRRDGAPAQRCSAPGSRSGTPPARYERSQWGEGSVPADRRVPDCALDRASQRWRSRTARQARRAGRATDMAVIESLAAPRLGGVPRQPRGAPRGAGRDRGGGGRGAGRRRAAGGRAPRRPRQDAAARPGGGAARPRQRRSWRSPPRRRTGSTAATRRPPG